MLKNNSANAPIQAYKLAAQQPTYPRACLVLSAGNTLKPRPDPRDRPQRRPGTHTIGGFAVIGEDVETLAAVRYQLQRDDINLALVPIFNF